MNAHDLVTTLSEVVLALIIVISFIKIVIRVFGSPGRETPQQLDAEAKRVGEAGALKLEKKVDEVFRDFRDRENLQ